MNKCIFFFFLLLSFLTNAQQESQFSFYPMLNARSIDPTKPLPKSGKYELACVSNDEKVYKVISMDLFINHSKKPRVIAGNSFKIETLKVTSGSVIEISNVKTVEVKSDGTTLPTKYNIEVKYIVK